MSSQTCSTRAGRGSTLEQRVEGRHAVDLGGRHREPLRRCARAPPSLIQPTRSCTRVQRGQQQVALRARLVAAAARCAPSMSTPRTPPSQRDARRAEQRVDGGALLRPWRSASVRLQVQSVSRPPGRLGRAAGARGDLLHADRGRLELRRARARVGGVDRQLVGVHLVGECSVMNASPGRSESSTRDRRLDRAAAASTRTISPSSRSSASASSGERYSDSPRWSGERYRLRLHAGVVRLEPAARGQAEREVGVERLDRRQRSTTDAERRRRAAGRLGPTAGRAGTASPDGPRRDTATGCRRAPRAAT